MKAMIFAAGLGTRLKPLTDSTPKALLPINGKPMLEHVILKLKDAGFHQIAINVHHLGDQIINFLAANNNLTTHMIIIYCITSYILQDLLKMKRTSNQLIMYDIDSSQVQ